MLLSVEFWHITFFKPLYMSQILSYIIYMGWLFYGYINRWGNKTSLCSNNNNRFVYILLISVFIASLNTYLFHNQPLSISIVTCRPMYTVLVLPVLLKMMPSDDEVRLSLNWFTVSFIVISILDSVLDIPLIDRASYSDFDATAEYITEGDFIHLLNGFVFVPLCLYYNLYDFNKGNRVNSLFFSCIILAFLVALQNRSTLFVSIILFAHTLYISKSKAKSVKFLKAFILLLVVYLIINSTSIWQSLITQTCEELNNSDYTRFLSINYFLNQASPNVLCYIFGNGFISTRTSSYMENLADMGIHNSDVGLIGFWNHFGFLPILFILFLCLKCLFTKKMPLYVKYNSLLILACSFTLSYFATASQILWLCFLLYGYAYNKYKCITNC